MSRNYITAERLKNADNYAELLQQCGLSHIKSTSKKATCYHKPHTISVSFAAGIVNSSKLPSDRYCGIGPRLESHNEMTCSAAEASSSNVYLSEKCDAPSMIMPKHFVEDDLMLPTSMLITKYDNRSPDNLFRIMQRKRCDRMFLPDQRENFLFFEQSDEQVHIFFKDLYVGIS